jgi:Ca-activated chloride channel family protein
MTSQIRLLSLSLLLLGAGQTLRAQLAPPDDFFNGGAQLYISNNIPAALERVANGLKTYPDNEKLKRLEQLLKQEQQQQQQQQEQNQKEQQQQQQQKDKQDQKQKDQQQKQQQQQQNQSSSEDQKKPDEKKGDDQKKADQQKPPEEQKPAAQKKDKDKDGDKKDQAEAAGKEVPGQLTPEDAKRLLDAQKDNEQLLQLKPDQKPRDQSRPVKDW